MLPRVTWKKQTQGSPLPPNQPRAETLQSRLVNPRYFAGGAGGQDLPFPTWPLRVRVPAGGSPVPPAAPPAPPAGEHREGCVCVGGGVVSLGGGTSLDGSNATAL